MSARPILTTSIVAILALPNYAQTADERLSRPAVEDLGETTRLEEVIVTADRDRTSYRAETATSATRLAAPIIDTPRNVQVVTQQLIQDRKINDPQEAVQNVSGVQRSGARSGMGETYIVRGFRQDTLVKDGFRVKETSGSSSFTFEGPTDVANIERVEVLKGPASILFGRGEPGGTVNYVTRTPVFENQFSLEQQVGSYDFYRTQLNANWDAVPGRVALRLDAAYENGDSFIDFVEGERTFVAPAFRWQLTDSTTFTFRGEYSNDHRSTTTGVPYINGQVLDSPYNRYFGEPGFTEMDNESFRGLFQLDHRWNESHLTSLAFHGAQSESDGLNFILFNHNGGPLQDPVTGDIIRAAEDIYFQNEHYTVRLDHTWDWTIYEGATETVTDKDGKSVTTSGSGFPTVKNQLLISGQFERETIDGFRVLSRNRALNPYRPNYTGYQPEPLLPSVEGFPVTFTDTSTSEADAFSILLLDRISFGDTVHLVFGGRYEWFTSDTSYVYSTFFGAAASGTSEETFNPTAGIVVKPARNVSLYGNYAESTYSFKSAGLTTVSGEPLDAERARQFEVGAKAEFLDGRLFTTLAFFHIDKTDVASVDPKNTFFSINAGGERSRGFEFDIAGEPLPGWRITANYAYIDARVEDDPAGFNTGHRLPEVPEHSGGIFTTYELQDGPLKGLGFGGGAYFRDRVEVDRENTGNLSGFAQLDAVVYYRRDRFRAQVNVKNLTDEEFYFASDAGGTEVQRGNARTVIGSIRYEF